MAEYYGKSSYSSSSRRHRGGRSAVGTMLDLVVGVMTLAVVALFILTLFVPKLDPREWGEVSTLGLIAPFIYAVQALLTLYWIVRWRLWVAVPMIVVSFVGLFQLSLFYKMEFRRVYTEPNLRPRYERSAIKVMTYNVRSFIDDDGERCLDSVAALVKSLNPDILCLQEMGFSELADSLFEPLKPMPRSLSRDNLSPAIYSRYPIVKAGRVDTLKNFVWADVVVRDDTIRVFNNHLHTTAIRSDDNTYLENHEYLEDDSLNLIRSMIHRLTENNMIRAEQADTLALLVEQSPYAAIVCGDFNDIPVSYTYRTVSEQLTDAFRQAGRGYSHTYRGFFDMLRIDYIFCTDEFDVLSYEVVDSWGFEGAKRRSTRSRPVNEKQVFLEKRYGHQVPLLATDEKRDSLDSLLRIVVDTIGSREVVYSDHYPVFVRLQYVGKTN